MAYMIEITEDKFEELGENVEKMLRYGGKVMSCIDHIKRKSGHMNERNMDYRSGGSMNERYMNERDGVGHRDIGGYWMNERGSMNERYDDDEREFQERRGGGHYRRY